MGLKSEIHRIVTQFFYPNMYVSIRQLGLMRKIFGKGNLIVEIGSFCGATTKRLARGNRVIAIDPFIGGYDSNRDGCSKGLDENRDKILSIFRKNTQTKNVIHLMEKSEEVLKRWKVPIDCLFIDGEHTLQAIKRDSRWIQHLKKGGFVAFHDIHYKFPELEKFVKMEIVPNYRFVAKRGSLWIFQK